MTVKFTTTEQESQSVKLLFEFQDHELPSEIQIDLNTKLGKNTFVGSLQSHQIGGIYVQPIVFSGMFKGTMLDSGGNLINANERSQQLGRLQGRPVKFFYDNIKTIVIIEKFSRKYINMDCIEYTIHLMPHDLQTLVTPTGIVLLKEQTLKLIEGDLTSSVDGVASAGDIRIQSYRGDGADNVVIPRELGGGDNTIHSNKWDDKVIESVKDVVVPFYEKKFDEGMSVLNKKLEDAKKALSKTPLITESATVEEVNKARVSVDAISGTKKQ